MLNSGIGGQEITLNILERFPQSLGLIVFDSRNVQGGINNIGVVGSLYESLEGEQIRWNSSIFDDPLVLHQCCKLGRNIVKAIGKWRCNIINIPERGGLGVQKILTDLGHPSIVTPVLF